MDIHIMVDSGAFSAWNRGQRIDLDDGERGREKDEAKKYFRE